MVTVKEVDETYYITAEYVINLASRAKELFEISEPDEKRLLINMALQNLRLNDENIEFDWVKPFDAIAESVNSPSWLPIVDDVRTIIENHEEYIYIPDLRSYIDI